MLLKSKKIVNSFKFTRLSRETKNYNSCNKCIYSSIDHNEYDCREVSVNKYRKLIHICQGKIRNYKLKHWYYVIEI